MSELNIYQRLNEVRKKVGYLQKDASVQGYKAITHDAVTSAIRDPFIENGVMVIPDQQSGQQFDVGKTSSGTTIIRYHGWYKIAFVNIDDPQDSFTCMIEAHAMDHGDKAPGKAMSYAVKYALLKVLGIETGESEESRIETAEKAKPILQQGVKKWEEAVEKVATGQGTIDVLKKHYRFDEEAFKAEVLEKQND